MTTTKFAERGAKAGKSAAGWVFDGNTTDNTYRRIAKMIEDGDPALYDHISEPEWLSGEWAGESISELLGDLLADVPEDEQDECLDEYSQAAGDAFWHEIERVIAFQLGE